MFAAAAQGAPDTDRMFVCPSGWVRYKTGCYLYMSSLSWSGAEAHCARQGASLATFHDVFEYSFLQSLIRQAGASTAWVGGFYFQTWRWLDQSRFTYFSYSSLNSATSYPCVYLQSRAGWTNGVCSTSRPFICMKRTDTC
ncbi:ladderlectin-like [Notolabrus celidotus]|uniref:ladderlectin-like n=1 Tax=Notolabrus celidotus TaxID=1203425 RepID=UPI00149071CB|nr:ladderlectin-like [Notolabrus celidotus]